MVPDHRGCVKRLKTALPESVFWVTSRTFTRVVSRLPASVTYGVGNSFGKRRAPYCYLEPSDVVVQVGSARDILRTGRSRPILLARRVPRGRVIVIEADPDNAHALQTFTGRHGIANITVVESGAWERPGELSFLSSAVHPAANLVEEVKTIDSKAQRKREYVHQMVKVDTIDNILDRLRAGVPRLVSITTNGAEIPILRGMGETMKRGCEYVSLALTQPGLIEHMAGLGYDYIAQDDRGYSFQKRGSGDSDAA
jgi:FkbM family methyltransferase